MQRLITKQEEQCYRLRHHDFGGLTTKETAEKMGISENTVRRLLKSVEVKAPQLFPVLTHTQHAVYSLYVEYGCTQRAIAIALDTAQSNIQAILDRIKKKGMPLLEPHGIGDMVAYENEMDAQVIHKF